MKGTVLTFLLLVPTVVGAPALGQSGPAMPPTVDKQHEQLASQLEEIAMCHHAIKAAHHEALYLDQNPYYRYLINSQEQGLNVYPIPARCNSLDTDWILSYTKLSDKEKADLDKALFGSIGMKISDMAGDAQFLTVIIRKMAIEGSGASLWENEDKDIPQP
jgi:hypothetical protein